MVVHHDIELKRQPLLTHVRNKMLRGTYHLINAECVSQSSHALAYGSGQLSSQLHDIDLQAILSVGVSL